MQKQGVTVALTGLALVAFAANSVLCRLALGESTIDPASYTAIRLISGALTLWIVASCRRDPSAPKVAGSWISAIMLFSYAVTFSFAYVSLGTGTGALILFASVQITMIGAGLVSGERPQLMEWAGLVIAMVGLLYLISPGITAPSPLGSLLMATAGIAWGYYSLRGRAVSDPIGATTDNFLRTAPLAVVVVVLWSSTLSVTPKGMLWAILSGSISSAIGYVVWYAALRGLTATRAAAVQLSVPVIAALGGVIFLSEVLTLRLSIAAAVILSGVGIAVWSRQNVVIRQEPSLSRRVAITGEEQL